MFCSKDRQVGQISRNLRFVGYKSQFWDPKLFSLIIQQDIYHSSLLGCSVIIVGTLMKQKTLINDKNMINFK